MNGGGDQPQKYIHINTENGEPYIAEIVFETNGSPYRRRDIFRHRRTDSINGLVNESEMLPPIEDIGEPTTIDVQTTPSSTAATLNTANKNK